MTDRLWAPWRSKYINSKKGKACIFCRALKTRGRNYVVSRSRHSIVMLNLFPYNNGHLLVAPVRHVGEITRLTEAEALDLFRSLTLAKKLLDKALKPQGYNIGINIGISAGAGILSHLHMHIVPRWRGDTNFMPLFYGTRIISQSLDELHKLLKRLAEKNVKSKKS